MFAAQENTEHTVFLLEVRRSLRSELLREMAYAFELESLSDTKNSIECVGARQIISYSADRKRLLCK